MHLNELLYPDDFLQTITRERIQREVLACERCPMVSCLSKKKDTVSRLESPFFMVVIDRPPFDFESELYVEPFFTELLRPFNIMWEHVYFTYTSKCENGDPAICEQFLSEEILTLKPYIVLHFSDTKGVLGTDPTSHFLTLLQPSVLALNFQDIEKYYQYPNLIQDSLANALKYIPRG